LWRWLGFRAGIPFTSPAIVAPLAAQNGAANV
jgi:hypothetical protein